MTILEQSGYIFSFYTVQFFLKRNKLIIILLCIYGYFIVLTAMRPISVIFA